MSADTLLALAALLIAVYALLPRARRLEFRIRFGLLQGLMVLVGFLLSLVLLYYEPISTIGFLPSWPFGYLHLYPPDVAFLVVLFVSAIALGLLAIRRLPRSRADELYELAEELSRLEDYSTLFNLLERHLPRLTDIYYQRFVDSQVRSALKRFSDRQYLPANQKANALKRLGGLLLARILNLIASLAGLASKLFPSHEKSKIAAREIFRMIASKKSLVEAMSRMRPYLPLDFVKAPIPFHGILMDTYLRCLLRDNGSVLYYEIKHNQNTYGHRKYELPDRNRLLNFLFSDPNFAVELAAWQPVGNEVIKVLEESLRGVQPDPLNYQLEDFAQEGKWESLVYVGIAYLDIMVSRALYHGVEWHMDLWYYLYFTQRIVQNFEIPTGVNPVHTEWPNKYSYLLYAMVSALRDWAIAPAYLPPDNPHVSIRNANCSHENSSIPKSSILVLAWSLREIVLSPNIPARLKLDLSDIVFGLYFELKEKPETDDFAMSLVSCLVGDGYSRGEQFRNELEVLFASHDKIPYDRDRVVEFESFLSGDK